MPCYFKCSKIFNHNGHEVFVLISEHNHEYSGSKNKKFKKRQSLPQEELVDKCNLIEWDISRGTLAKIESQVRRVIDIEVALFSKAL